MKLYSDPKIKNVQQNQKFKICQNQSLPPKLDKNIHFDKKY